MERITFEQLPEMVALILEKLIRIENLLGSASTTNEYKNNFSVEKEMLTASEAAQFIGVSMSSIYKMSFNNEVPKYKPTGGKLYFKKHDLIDWMSSNRIMSNVEIEQEAIDYIIKHPYKRRK